MDNQCDYEDIIKISNEEYTIGTTEQGEKYLLKFDTKANKEIKIVFSNESTENVTEKVIQTLSGIYINEVLENLK